MIWCQENSSLITPLARIVGNFCDVFSNILFASHNWQIRDFDLDLPRMILDVFQRLTRILKQSGASNQ